MHLSTELSLSFVFPTKTLRSPILCRMRVACPNHRILVDPIAWIIFVKGTNRVVPRYNGMPGNKEADTLANEETN